MCAVFTLTIILGARQGAFAQTFGPGVIATNDLTQSLGQFSIIINPAFQAMMAGGGGYPNYNATTHVLTSPVLYDGATIVGRSAPLQAGSTGDINGVPVGVAGVIISNAMMTVQPAGLEPAGTREVHTMIYAMNMTDENGSAVRAGTNATVQPVSAVSPGEVESWSGATGLPANDFPAQSFFDVFVDVDVAAGGSFPGATNLYNTMPLMVQNTNLTSFPPQVVYIHGMSTAVPIKFSSGPYAGQIFGILTLAGHGVFGTNDSTGQNQTKGQATTALQNALAATPPAPVEPQYSTWSSSAIVANSNTMTFPVKGDDTTPSLGTFVLAVNPAYQSLVSGSSYWNPTTKLLTSPLLYGPTVIGRSAQTNVQSRGDALGVQVGTANTVVSDFSFAQFLPGFAYPSNTYEVKTELRSLDMIPIQGGSGFAVRAGTNAPNMPHSYGEVNSLSGASGDPYWDFPAKSFFDVFVDVDFPAGVGGGSTPAFTVTNRVPLIVQNNALTSFPPNVVYVHGNTTAVPVYFTNTTAYWQAGDVFGILLLAGHGVGFSNNAAAMATFQQTVAQMPEMPVAPQYATWASGLNVPLQVSTVKLTNGIPTISGYCTPSDTLTLQSTTNLSLQAGGPVWVDEVTTTGTTNSTFIVAPPSKSTTSAKFYRMVDNTR